MASGTIWVRVALSAPPRIGQGDAARNVGCLRTQRCSRDLPVRRRGSNLRSPWRRRPRTAEVPVRRIFGWVSGGRRIANSDREGDALAALQFQGGDDFGQQTGVCDASTVLGPE